MKKKIITHSAAATKRIGKDIARSLAEGCVIALEGNLGAGKTVLAKGIAEGLGVAHVIQSPTFVLMKVYPVKRPGISHFVHVDCYRVSSSRELIAIGLDDYVHDGTTVVVIEWSDKIRDMLPSHRIDIRLSAQGEKNRTALIHDARLSSKNSILHRARGRRV
jgi:tRNA threonylcarbamoyladenosine biosynthesis protein TsaE